MSTPKFKSEPLYLVDLDVLSPSTIYQWATNFNLEVFRNVGAPCHTFRGTAEDLITALMDYFECGRDEALTWFRDLSKPA